MTSAPPSARNWRRLQEDKLGTTPKVMQTMARELHPRIGKGRGVGGGTSRWPFKRSPKIVRRLSEPTDIGLLGSTRA